MDIDLFNRLESEVHSYCLIWPAVFTRAQGATIWDEDGRAYIDFFAGAGALNYGHNDPALRDALIAYIQNDGITHSLDMATAAKREFMARFEAVILRPRGLDYKVQFPGPTGTNAVEAALKLARKVTGRQTVVHFTNAFHGMTLGALAVTGNATKRSGAGVPLSHAVAMPYDGFLGTELDTTGYLATFLQQHGSGVELPAAVIVETLQGEGGLHTASTAWLRRLAGICRDQGVLLIVDDIQAGCGRTGTFFSFEPAGITPDIVCLSKSLSGYGLPMAVTLLRPELDVWSPGEHNGTFRGNNHAFTTAAAALRYWETDTLAKDVERKADRIRVALEDLAAEFPTANGTSRGRGLLQGLHCPEPGLAERVCTEAFARGLILETSGTTADVVKLLPPLTIDDETLARGITILRESFAAALGVSQPDDSTALTANT